MSSTPASLDYIILGCRGIPLRSLLDDIHMFLYSILSELADDTWPVFEDIRNYWDTQDFVLIHFGCPERQSRTIFLQTIYAIFCRYLYMADPEVYGHRAWTIKAVVAWSLWLLYSSQPDTLPKIPIRTPPRLILVFCYENNMSVV